MTTLYIMIGASGSGKSRKAREIFDLNDYAALISTDAIRAYLAREKNPDISYADAENDQSQNVEVFQRVKTFITYSLCNNQDVVYDATNLIPWTRQDAVELARKYGARIVAVHINTPLEVCKSRNAVRSRKVSAEVIERQHNSYVAPVVGVEVDELVEVPYLIPSLETVAWKI